MDEHRLVLVGILGEAAEVRERLVDAALLEQREPAQDILLAAEPRARHEQRPQARQPHGPAQSAACEREAHRELEQPRHADANGSERERDDPEKPRALDDRRDGDREQRSDEHRIAAGAGLATQGPHEHEAEGDGQTVRECSTRAAFPSLPLRADHIGTVSRWPMRRNFS